MLTTFHAAMSRSSRLLWLIEELEAPYRLVPITIARPDGTGGPDGTNPHPLRQVPCVLDDGELVVESLAIWLHLADAYPAAGLASKVGDPERARYMGWMGAATAVLEPVVLAARDGGIDTDRVTHARLWLSERIEAALAAWPWLLGPGFSAVDVVYASLIAYFPDSVVMSERIGDWLARCTARPALQRARDRDQAAP